MWLSLICRFPSGSYAFDEGAEPRTRESIWPISVLTLWIFRGLDSSITLILRGGILMSIRNFPEILSQAILVGIMLVGRLGVEVRESTRVVLGDIPKGGWCGVLSTLVSCYPLSLRDLPPYTTLLKY